MIRKIISIFFALIFIGSIISINPKQSEAATVSFNATISTETTDSCEKVVIAFPRKINSKTYSYTAGSKMTKSGIVSIGKKQTSNEARFTITPIKKGNVDFAIGLYHYNGGSTDMSIYGILEFHVEVKAKANGSFYISNLKTSLVKSACYSSRNVSTERYSFNKFKQMSTKTTGEQITFKCTSSDVTGSDINALTQKYNVKKYYLVNGKHVHVYKNGVCTKCDAEKRDYDASGFSTLFYKTDPPEKGRLLTVNPKLSDGRVLGIPVQVYLPYGYKNTNKYNVIFLVPGSDGTIYNWMKDKISMFIPDGETYGDMSGKRLFDWLIYTGQSAPFIAVSISMQPYNGSYDQAYSRYVNFIRDYWLPMIIDGQGQYTDSNNNKQVINFGGTYAKSSKESDIKSAKSHFAIAGLSQGSTFVVGYAVNPTSDLGKRFGHKIIMSSFTPANSIATAYNKSSNNKDKLYFVSGGKIDKSGNGTSSYDIMMSYKKNSTLKKFPFYTMNSGHKFYTWFRGIAAVLQDSLK